MSYWKIFPGLLILAVFILIAPFSISINGELQSGWISKNRPERFLFPLRVETTEEPSYQFTTTEEPFYHPKQTKNGLDHRTTRKDVAQLPSGGSLKNGTVSSPKCVYTKEEAYCQRVLIIAILLVTFTIVSSASILCLLQYFHLRKYTFYFNESILPNQENSTCTTLNGVTVKEVAL